MGRLKSKEKCKVYFKKSSPCWFVRFNLDNGTEVRRSTGYRRTDYPDKAVVQEIFNISSGESASNVYTISWMEKYIDTRLKTEKRSEKTLEAYATAFEYFKERYGDKYDIEYLTRGCASELQNHLSKKGLSNSTINLYVGKIQSSLERLVIEDKIAKNPLYKFKKLPVEHTRKCLTKNEAKKFLNHVNGLKNQKLKHLTRILIFTGLRRSEILGIQREDVDLEKSTFETVNIKSRDKHKIKRGINPEIWHDFEYFLHSSRLDLPFKVMTPSHFTKLVKQCMRAISLPEDLHLHSLRHTYITFAIEQGANIRSVQKYIDHASIGMTESYAHDESDNTPHITIL
jgi:site-specific recombinase XerD